MCSQNPSQRSLALAPVGYPRLWFGLPRSALWARPKGCRNAHDKSATWCLHSPAESALSFAPRLKQTPLLLTPLPSTARSTCTVHCVPQPGAPTVILTRGLESITLISAWARTHPPSGGHSTQLLLTEPFSNRPFLQEDITTPYTWLFESHTSLLVHMSGHTPSSSLLSRASSVVMTLK